MESLLNILSKFDKSLLFFIKENLIFFYIIATIVIVYIKEASKTNIRTASIVYIVGTFFHELAHYVVAWITTLSMPNKMSIIPTEERNGTKKWYTLGYVSISNSKLNTLNAFPIAFAPLTLLYLSYIMYENFFTYYTNYFEITSLSMILYVFLIVTLVVNSIPSRADIEMSKTKGSHLLWITILSASIYYKGFIQ